MKWKGYTWYPYFNNKINASKDVLMRNENVYFSDIIVARMEKSKSPQFAKLKNIDEFIKLYDSCSIDDRTFYAVFINNMRHLYIDVDYPLKHKLKFKAKNQLIIKIIKALNEFNYTYASKHKIKIHKQKWIIWDATRNDKFSLHMINNDVICDCAVMHDYIIKFDKWCKKNAIIPENCHKTMGVILIHI